MVSLKDQPVYLLAGSEQFLKEKFLAKIKSTFLEKDSQDFNFNVFYAGTSPIEKALECAGTAPFLGRKRVVLMRQIEQLSVSGEKFILSYVKAPHKQTLLVLETSKTNLNSDFFSEICKYAQLIFCNPLKKPELLGWIKAQVEAQGKTIEKEAIQVLADNLGDSLQLLASAVDSLILYIGQKTKIEVGDVEKLVGPDVNSSAFELFDALIVRDKQRSFQILDGLLKHGVNSSQILGALAHKVISGRSRMDDAFLERSLLDLQKTDSDIKTGRQGQKIALELLLARLLQLT